MKKHIKLFEQFINESETIKIVKGFTPPASSEANRGKVIPMKNSEIISYLKDPENFTDDEYFMDANKNRYHIDDLIGKTVQVGTEKILVIESLNESKFGNINPIEKFIKDAENIFEYSKRCAEKAIEIVKILKDLPEIKDVFNFDTYKMLKTNGGSIVLAFHLNENMEIENWTETREKIQNLVKGSIAPVIRGNAGSSYNVQEFDYTIDVNIY